MIIHFWKKICIYKKPRPLIMRFPSEPIGITDAGKQHQPNYNVVMIANNKLPHYLKSFSLILLLVSYLVIRFIAVTRIKSSKIPTWTQMYKVLGLPFLSKVTSGMGTGATAPAHVSYRLGTGYRGSPRQHQERNSTGTSRWHHWCWSHTAHRWQSASKCPWWFLGQGVKEVIFNRYLNTAALINIGQSFSER